ncbi:heparinase II/III family protein [Sphingomonas sp. Mn802worker]|uniref:heparinase II/III family protein n=1 Tax=Sphingomonas sp. Mn802worker TaxID=629773 RepID=UPI00036B7668|nr:heparinase II/III family protein [Sphingomonas sp. Mn802worker]
MSDARADGHTDESARDTIEAGHRMVRAAGEGSASLGQRVADYFDRLTWRTPIHDMRLKGRYPRKLLAVPADPVAGSVEYGEALTAGWLAWGSEFRALDEVTFAASIGSAAFDDHAQSFAWLRDLWTAPDRAAATRTAEILTQRWLAVHGERVTERGWRPDLWGRRMLMWTAHAPLLLSSADLIYRSSVLSAIARGARHLDRTADKAPVGVRRIAAWCGVVAAGLLIPGGDPRRAIGETGLERALALSVGSDGGIASRSPRDQLDAIELLACLRAAYDARRLDLPEGVAQVLARMVSALLGTMMGDAGLSSWQGAGPIAADEVQAVLHASRVVRRPLRQASDRGYQRIAAARSVLVMDAAPPPTTPGAAGACASTLAFELSDGEERVVVNCGGAAVIANIGLAAGLRSTAAHSTLVLADSNSTALLPDGSLGRGVSEVDLSRQESDAGSRIEARHDGYARRFGFRHHRIVTMATDGLELRGEDSLLPTGKRPARGGTPFALRFHLGAGVEVMASADAQGATLMTPGGATWHFRAAGATVMIDDSVWIDPERQIVPTRQIVAGGSADPGGATISWIFKRAR